jgi:excisionase family DNA binding protein
MKMYFLLTVNISNLGKKIMDVNPNRSRLVLLNVENVAEQLGVSVATIYRWRSLGENCPPAFKIGSSVRWSQDSVDNWLSAQMEQAN